MQAAIDHVMHQALLAEAHLVLGRMDVDVDAARIDHFRGFVSWWGVPKGERTALAGGWHRGPGRALFDAVAAELGLPPAEGFWFVLQPAHFHVARDHLVLTDLRQLSIDEQESRTFFDVAFPLFDELGHELRYGDARRWFLRADDWHALRTTTPDVATGHNVDVWLPSGERAREWRKLHNEVQMSWHMHPLNDEREARCERRVNAMWLWGGASATDAVTSSDSQVDDSLITHALAGDWGRWLGAMQAIETKHAAPLLSALQSGAIDRLTVQLTDATRIRSWRATRASMRKFWVKPSLSRLR